MELLREEILYFLVSTTHMAHHFHRVPELFLTKRTTFFPISNQLKQIFFIMSVAVVTIESLFDGKLLVLTDLASESLRLGVDLFLFGRLFVEN